MKNLLERLLLTVFFIGAMAVALTLIYWFGVAFISPTQCYVVSKTWESVLNNSTAEVWQETRQKVKCDD